ncbi:MAG: hypothetical protein OHK0029_24890 [Armatimonadaceae bacterium]
MTVMGDSTKGMTQAVRSERVTFKSGDETLVGTLFLPENYRQGERVPAVLVTGAWMTVKEQMPKRYATELAKRGFAALIFDFAGWGESEGKRRQLEDPSRKIADIIAAAAYLKTRPEADPDRIGGLGICASSGYMVHAASRSGDIASVALVAPWLHNAGIVETTYGGKEEVAKLIAAGKAAEDAYRRTGTQEFVPAASTTDKRAIMFGVPYYTETDRGQIPAWRNEVDPAFWEGWLTFDAVAVAPRLSQPFFMVHSEAAAIPQGAHQFFASVRAPKGELWLENIGQLDFYDRNEPVTKASDAVAKHFRSTLTGATNTPTNRAEQDARAIAGTREFFAALEAGDIPRFLKVWAEDGVQEMPFAPGNFPRRLEGKEAIERQYGPLPKAYTGMRFPIRRMMMAQEPGVVIAEYDGSIGLKSGGRYDNRYVGIFTFNSEGNLQHFTEYFDPYTLIQGFPGAAEAVMPDAEKIEAIVHSLGKAADGRDWQGVRRTFAEEVDFDYTSVAGGAPARLKAEGRVGSLCCS